MPHKEAKRDFNQISLLIVAAMGLYSTSTDDLKSVLCFFISQETGDELSMVK